MPHYPHINKNIQDQMADSRPTDPALIELYKRWKASSANLQLEGSWNLD